MQFFQSIDEIIRRLFTKVFIWLPTKAKNADVRYFNERNFIQVHLIYMLSQDDETDF